MRGKVILIMVACGAANIYAGDEFKHAGPPQVAYIFNSQGNVVEPANCREALRQGIREGVAGGAGLLIKSLILAIPTGCYILWKALHARSDKAERITERIKGQTELLIARTKYTYAFIEWLKAQKLKEQSIIELKTTEQDSMITAVAAA